MERTSNPAQETLEQALLVANQEKSLDADFLEEIDKAKGEEYDKIINDKMKLIEEYENLEKDLQAKRQQLENDLNISINKSKGLNTPDNKKYLMKSSGNLFETDSSFKEPPIKLTKNFNSLEKENLQSKEFASYFMKMNSETKIKENQDEYTFKPKINKSLTKKNLDQIVENKDIILSRVDELYNQGLMKKQKHDDLIKQQKHDINGSINQDKIGLNSKKIVLKNMEKSLGKLLEDIESPNNKGLLNFQDIGSFMEKLGIFKGTHYKRNSHLEKLCFEPAEIEKFGLEVLEKESNFHEHFWKILIIPQLLSSEKEAKDLLSENSIVLIPCQLLLDVILALLETNREKFIVASLIRERLLNSFKKQEVPIRENHEKERNLDIEALYEGDLCLPLTKFIGKFRELFVDKTKVMTIYSTKEIKLDKEHEPSVKVYDFKPKINEKSKNLDSQDNYFAKLVSSNSMKDLSKNRYDLLYNYSKYESKKKEEETKARLKEDNRDCTFAPKINKKISSGKKKPVTEEKTSENIETKNENGNENPENDERKTYERLYELYKKKFEKELINNKIIQNREEEKLIGCTFKPQTNVNKNLERSLYSANTNNVKGAEKVIERVAKAREERQEKINLFENMGKAKGDGLQPTVFQPFSFEKKYDTKEKENSGKEEPLLYLDINYGPGKIARIPVRKSDDPHVLCKTFSKIYSLNEKMQATLLETIQNIFRTQVWEEKK